jgi:outer membrane protein assembly factor BamB
VFSSPAVVGGAVHIGSYDSKSDAMDTATDEEVWHYELDHWIRSQQAVANGMVYLGSHDNGSSALDMKTREVLGSYRRRDAVSAGAMAVDGTVCITPWDSSVHALRAQPSVQPFPLWHLPLLAEGEMLARVPATCG